jgi:hypothetical protein
MESSILEQYWNQQEKERPLSTSSASTRSNVIDEKFDHITSRSDVFSSQSSFRTDFESNSRTLLTPSSTNITIKEFCAVEKEEEDEEKDSFKRFVYHQTSSLWILPGCLGKLSLVNHFFQVRIGINHMKFRSTP